MCIRSLTRAVQCCQWLAALNRDRQGADENRNLAPVYFKLDERIGEQHGVRTGFGSISSARVKSGS